MFTAKKKVIYSKRYHFEEEVAELEALNLPMSEEEKKRAQASFEKLLREERESTVYVEKPGAEERERRFIRLAKQLSEKCEIDMDITRYPGYIGVTLHLFAVPFFSDFTSLFSRLVRLCDYMDILPEKNGPNDFRVECDMYTHDRYVGGKKILL